jgi:hypothetical protein
MTDRSLQINAPHRCAASRAPAQGARTLFLAILCGLALALPVHAQGEVDLGGTDGFNKGGRTTFQFLKIGVGARQVALGSAGVALAQDVNSVFWNPAAITGIERFEASFSYTRWIGDMNYVGGAIGGTLSGIGSVVFSVASLDYGNMQEALVGGEGTNDTRTGNTVSGGDLMAGLTFSRRFTDRLSIGLTGKLLHESLWEYGVTTYAFDVGTYFDMDYNGMVLAMSLQNYGGSVNFLEEGRRDREEGYDLPLIFRIGVSTRLFGAQDAFLSTGPAHDVVVSAEAINTNDFSERVHFGIEYTFSNLLTLRGGYRFNYEEGNWSAGFGLAPEIAGTQIRLDYAYGRYNHLSDPHRLTMTVAF